MAFKFVLFACLLAAVNAGDLAIAPAQLAAIHAAPIARVASPILAPSPIARVAVAPVAKALAVADVDFDPNPQYSYAYDIQDALTGDSKSHVESRSGDVVQGQYSLVEPDGTRRIVQYIADPINGFNAVVQREPLVKAIATKIATPVAYAAPIAPIAKVAAPIAYSAPIAKVAAPIAYSAPINKFVPAPYALGNAYIH